MLSGKSEIFRVYRIVASNQTFAFGRFEIWAISWFTVIDRSESRFHLRFESVQAFEICQDNESSSKRMLEKEKRISDECVSLRTKSLTLSVNFVCYLSL